jgi:hypothetical protein
VQYMLLIYEGPGDFAARTTDKTAPYVAAWRAYHQALVAAGAYVTGTPLQPIETATTVRVTDGQHHVQDGPYADTKEQLGGVCILELPSLDAALAWAARCPAAAYGAVEVRPLAPDLHDTIVT